MEYQEIERPALRRRGNSPDSLAGGLRATAVSGKAIAVSAEKARAISGRLHRHLKSQGYRVHRTRLPDGTYAAWCEKIEPNGAGPA